MESARTTTASARVLVVDDEAIFARRLRMTFQEEGYKAEAAFGPRAALSLWTSFKPDLVVLDVMMPVLDGIECLRIMREHESVPDVPVILVTGDPSSRVEEAAQQYSDCHVLRKPCTYEQVVAFARRVLGV